MRDYKNTILLCDYDDDRVDAIIFTNENEETIQDAISLASDKWYEEECLDCQLNYVLEYLDSHYDVLCIDAYTRHITKVYY
jgi:hypothetical protein